MAEKRTSTPSDEDQSSPKKSKTITEVLENSEERGMEDTKPSTSNEKVKKHICTTCGKCYAQNKDLLHYQRLKHVSDEKKHICTRCGKCYAQNKDLLHHGDSGEDEDFEESLEELVCPPAIDPGLLQAQPDTE